MGVTKKGWELRKPAFYHEALYIVQCTHSEALRLLVKVGSNMCMRCCSTICGECIENWSLVFRCEILALKG